MLTGRPTRARKSMRKFMQTLDESYYRRLQREAKSRGITVQELIRALVIPDWVEQQQGRNRVRS